MKMPHSSHLGSDKASRFDLEDFGFECLADFDCDVDD